MPLFLKRPASQPCGHLVPDGDSKGVTCVCKGATGAIGPTQVCASGQRGVCVCVRMKHVSALKPLCVQTFVDPPNDSEITMTLTENPYGFRPLSPDLSTSGGPEERADPVTASP